jgi:hypothetical protein
MGGEDMPHHWIFYATSANYACMWLWIQMLNGLSLSG